MRRNTVPAYPTSYRTDTCGCLRANSPPNQFSKRRKLNVLWHRLKNVTHGQKSAPGHKVFVTRPGGIPLGSPRSPHNCCWLQPSPRSHPRRVLRRRYAPLKSPEFLQSTVPHQDAKRHVMTSFFQSMNRPCMAANVVPPHLLYVVLADAYARA